MLLIHDNDFENWAFDPSHPTQGRRFINGRNAIIEQAEILGIEVEERLPFQIYPETLIGIHAHEYVLEVTENHRCDEWVGVRPDLSALAVKFVASTLTALDSLVKGEHLTAVNLTGAKHHAQYQGSSGFCVFADFALASKSLTQEGKKVAILDIDAHHGDGTENLTRYDENVLTYSIHQGGIFPNTGNESNEAQNVYNLPLKAYSGGDELMAGVEEFIDLAISFGADYIFVAGGADGHHLDPLAELEYTTNDYRDVGLTIRHAFPDTPILVGGAGGYRPDDATPLAWSALALGLSNS